MTLKILFCLLIGYVLGIISPAALISKIKNTDLRNVGTKNLGATNTFLSVGKLCGVFVMIVDVSKAFLAYKICRFLFPQIAFSGIVAGIGAIIGHVFPFYMKFKGGKGLAAYAGLVLAHDPVIFLLLLVICTTLMVVVNYSVAMPISAAVLFPILCALRTHSFWIAFFALIAGLVIVTSHFEIVLRIKNNEEMKVRDVIKEKVFNIT